MFYIILRKKTKVKSTVIAQNVCLLRTSFHIIVYILLFSIVSGYHFADIDSQRIKLKAPNKQILAIWLVTITSHCVCNQSLRPPARL